MSISWVMYRLSIYFGVLTRRQTACLRKFSCFPCSLSFPTSCPLFSEQHWNGIKSFAQECMKCLWVWLCENPFYTSGRFSGKLSPVFLEAMTCSGPTTQKLNLHHLLGTWVMKIAGYRLGFSCALWTERAQGPHPTLWHLKNTVTKLGGEFDEIIMQYR